MAYSQNDPKWANDFLGTSRVWKMGPAGCFVTALANVAKALGHDITPGELNRQLTAKGLINSEGEIIRDNVLSEIFPDIEYVETKSWTTTDADLAYFDVHNDLNTELIAMIDYSPNPGLQTHFTRAIGRNGNDVTVDDSWDGVRKGVSAYCYGRRPADIIYKAIKYRKQAINTPQGGNKVITDNGIRALFLAILKHPANNADLAFYRGKTWEKVVDELTNLGEYAKVNEQYHLGAEAPALQERVQTLGIQLGKYQAMNGDATKWQTLMTLLGLNK